MREIDGLPGGVGISPKLLHTGSLALAWSARSGARLFIGFRDRPAFRNSPSAEGSFGQYLLSRLVSKE
jgi:hypothetical protein